MEKETIRRLCRDNLRAMELYAAILQMEPGFFSPDEISRFAKDCGITADAAFSLLIASACGLEPDRRTEDRRLMERYLIPALRVQEAQCYRENPYYSRVRFPEARRGSWQLTQLSYQPYQVFPRGDTAAYPDGREIVPLGYFPESFSYPAVLENGREWMTVTPNEIETMAVPIEKAHGNMAVFGLGLGYYAYRVSEKKNVSHITVIERDKDAISLFREYLLPQFPNKNKIRVVQADAFDYLNHEMKKESLDFAFVDLWHDISDGLPLYLRFRKMEAAFPETEFQYWIEQSMLIFLRSLFLDDWIAHAGKLDRLLPGSVSPERDFSLDSIRSLAPQIDEKDLR